MENSLSISSNSIATKQSTELSFPETNIGDALEVFVVQDSYIAKYYFCDIISVSQNFDVVTILAKVSEGSVTTGRNLQASVSVNGHSFKNFNCMIGEVHQGNKMIKVNHVFCQIFLKEKEMLNENVDGKS